jgi:hypothetical protein
VTLPATAPWSLVHGASWLLPDGEVIIVPSFHEEWLRDNPDLAAGSRNVCELVLRRGWVSVALFAGGYLELMVPDRRDPALRGRLKELLSRNRGAWSKALVMSMDEEGYAMLEPGDERDEASLAARLESTV